MIDEHILSNLNPDLTVEDKATIMYDRGKI